MPEAAVVPLAQRNPPVDYAVAVWLGTPNEEIEKGLREGWIRRAGVPPQARVEDREAIAIVAPPAPDDARDPLPAEASAVEARTRIQTLLRSIDPALDAGTFADAWNEAGPDEATRAGVFVEFIGRALNAPLDQVAGAGSRLEALEQAADAVGTTARFVRLQGMTGQELERLAGTEGGVRRALAEHSPWAFSGSRELARLGDGEGRFDRFDPDTGEVRLSDAWLGDRARHTAWRHAEGAGRPLEVDGDGWRFIDRAAGESVSLEIQGSAAHPPHQVIFARDDGDRVNGGATTDRIHGGGGDDILRGRAGDDLLEGGAGTDALQGGSGRDLLAGQQGDDDLDGGAGDDRLEGGSGDDELYGGSGNDVLRGGAGVDTYRFESGDGADTIEDDGGAVMFDDVAIAGTMRREGDGWISSDGRFRLALEDERGDGGTLVIHHSGSGVEGASGSTVRIDAWTQGAFGISLAGGDDEGEEDQNEAGDATQAFSPALQQPGEGGEGAIVSDAGGDGASADAPSLGLAADRFARVAFVDAQAVHRALEAWSPPSPPDVVFPLDLALGVTPSDLANAIADSGTDAGDEIGGASITLESWFASPPPGPANGGPRSPPDPALRSVS